MIHTACPDIAKACLSVKKRAQSTKLLFNLQKYQENQINLQKRMEKEVKTVDSHHTALYILGEGTQDFVESPERQTESGQ